MEAVIVALIAGISTMVGAWLQSRKRKATVLEAINKMTEDNAADHAKVQGKLAELTGAFTSWTDQHDQRHTDLNERLDTLQVKRF